MSNRTSEANKAIAAAWVNEKQLVLDGKGTRNWTPEQQNDILTKGKAYGEDGKAFEGHHMKSAEAYPEFQGECSNIEFLSRTEHFSAHNGDFKTPTNGYFNPQTGETKDFGNNPYEPCKAKKLSNPISTQQSAEIKFQKTIQSMQDNESTSHQDSVVSKLNSMGHKHTDAETKANPSPQSTKEALHNMQANTNTNGNSEGKGE